jgi:hypothetical protein
LRRQHPQAALAVLCLDERVEEILRASAPSVRILSLARLFEIEPDLERVRGERKPWEFYATAKPAYLHTLLAGLPGEEEVLAYIDADAFFFSNPLPVFEEEIMAHSIVVSPHRFSPGSMHLSIYGPYNAGFGIWRGDAEGRRCLRDWADDCRAWCHESVLPDGRFMNQGYLATWPGRYRAVRATRHPGINLAPWNVAAHSLRPEPGGMRVDDAPLVFFHFSGLARGQDGQWRANDIDNILRHPWVMDRLYVPYIAELEATRQYLLDNYGLDGVASVR